MGRRTRALTPRLQPAVVPKGSATVRGILLDHHDPQAGSATLPNVPASLRWTPCDRQRRSEHPPPRSSWSSSRPGTTRVATFFRIKSAIARPSASLARIELG